MVFSVNTLSHIQGTTVPGSQGRNNSERGADMVRFGGLWFVLLAVVGVTASAVIAQEPAEFIAQDKDFVNYTTWKEAAKATGPTKELRGAHQSTDPNVTRFIYVNGDKARKENGQFPVGTIIVKQYVKTDGSVTGATAMVKRGNGFSKDAGDWEWFAINAANQTIARNAAGNQQRGINAACITCHMQAKDKDLVFTF
jgi:hypothetical protein